MRPSPRVVLPVGVTLCFVPAGLGLLHHALQPIPLPQRLLAVALGLMAVEQAQMARVDVQRVLAVDTMGQPDRLPRFALVLGATILGELVGFYLAAAGWLGLGMLTILISLLGFNLLANGRFEGQTFQPAGPRSRLDVIGIDLIALGLVLLWGLGWGQLAVASLLLGITLTYGTAKVYAYATARFSLADPPRATSAIHIPHPTQQHPQPPQQDR